MADVVRGGLEDLDALEPLWLALREHHGSITPEWGELRPPAESWAMRRATYVKYLEEGTGVLFLAHEGRRLVGHAYCEVEQGGSPTWLWPADFLAVVDLVVAPEARGSGAGAQLLAAAEAEARARGLAALDLSVVAGNHEARRFYEREGFRADLVTYRKPLT